MFTLEESFNSAGLVWVDMAIDSMAAISSFCDSNITALTSCEDSLFSGHTVLFALL